MDNIYEVEYNHKKYICHFDEIAYFIVGIYNDKKYFSPHTKQDETLPATTDEDILKKYINYKNGL